MFFGKMIQKSLHFGKQLSGGIQKFGGQVNHISTKIGAGIDKAERKVAGVEKWAKHVPIVGQVVTTVDKGLRVGKDITNVGGLVGTGIQNLGKGDLHSFAKTVDNIKNQGKQAVSDASGVIASGASVASKFI